MGLLLGPVMGKPWGEEKLCGTLEQERGEALSTASCFRIRIVRFAAACLRWHCETLFFRTASFDGASLLSTYAPQASVSSRIA